MKELIEIRKKRGLSQLDLSILTDIPQPTISRYEKGLRSPDSGNLRKIALALKCSSDDLLGITEEVKKFKTLQSELINKIK